MKHWPDGQMILRRISKGGGDKKERMPGSVTSGYFCVEKSRIETYTVGST